MEDKVFISCNCGSEAILLERDPYPENIELPKDVYMSFFRYGHNEYFPWSLRLKYIWQIIRKGHPFSDCVILNNEEQEKLIEFLTDKEK